MSDIQLPSGIIVPGTVGKWDVVPERTSDYWLEVRAPDGSWHGFVTQDGCVQIYERDPSPIGTFDDHACQDACEHYHLDDLDDFIDRLVALRDLARQQFGDRWK